MYYHNGDLYIGDWDNDCKHGNGKYFNTQGEKYIGTWRNDMRHGRGKHTMQDGSYYHGHYYQNNRHGQGEYYSSRHGVLYNERYEHGQLQERVKVSRKRTSQPSQMNSVQDGIDNTNVQTSTHSNMLKNKSHESLINLNKQNSGKLQSVNQDCSSQQTPPNFTIESYIDNENNAYKTLDVGLETLDMIENYIDNRDGFIIDKNKNIQDYTITDIGDWLVMIGLQDYVQIFKENHITGKNLFEILEKELKEEF